MKKKKNNIFEQTNISLNFPINKTIQDFSNAIIKKARKNAFELVIIIKDLDIYNFEGIVTMKLKADFYLGYNNTYYFYKTHDDFFEKRDQGYGNQDRVVSLLNDVWFDYIFDARFADPKQLFTQKPISVNTAFAKNDDYQYPIYTTDHYNKGVYVTVNEFLNNKPDDSIRFFNEYNDLQRSTKIFKVTSKGKKGRQVNSTEYFAYFDGKNWYAGGERQPELMTKENGNFITKRFLPSSELKYNIDKRNYGKNNWGGLTTIVSGVIQKKSEMFNYYTAALNPNKEVFMPVHKLPSLVKVVVDYD